MRGGRVPEACGFGAQPERRPGSCARAQADSSTTLWGRARILLPPARGRRCREPAIAARPEGDARGGDGGGAGRGSEPSSHPRALDRRCAGRSPPGGGAARGEREAGALRDPAPVTRLTWARRRPLRLLECGVGRGRTVRTSNSPRLLCCLLETKRETWLMHGLLREFTPSLSARKASEATRNPAPAPRRRVPAQTAVPREHQPGKSLLPNLTGLLDPLLSRILREL